MRLTHFFALIEEAKQLFHCLRREKQGVFSYPKTILSLPPNSVGKESQPSAKLGVWYRDKGIPSHCYLQSYRRQAKRQGYIEWACLLSFGHPASTFRPATVLWCLRDENHLDCFKLLKYVKCVAKPKQILLLQTLKLKYVQANIHTIYFTNCMAHSPCSGQFQWKFRKD